MKKIVILGGGFGGVRAALDLDKKLSPTEASITLVDRNNFQTFQPSLYEVASAFDISHDNLYYEKLKNIASISYKNILLNTNIKFVQSEIANINLQNKTILTFGGNDIEFDYLIISLGSTVSTYNIEGVNEYACKFNSLDDALILFRDIESCYSIKSKKVKHEPVRFLIVGAGFNGIELGTELSLCSTHMKHKHDLKLHICAEITLLEALPNILPMVSDKERKIVDRRIKKLNIKVMESSPIEKILNASTAKLKDGRELVADFIIWTAGIRPPELLAHVSGLALNKSGRIIVNDFLQVKNFKEVFAIGDNAVFIDPKSQKPIPQMAYLAVDQAKIAAKNIVSLIKSSRPQKKYKPWYNVWVAPVGGKNAIAHIGPLTLSGFLGWVIHGLIEFKYFLGVLSFAKALRLVKNRLSVFLKND